MHDDECSASDDTMIIEEGVDRSKPSVVVVGYADQDAVVLSSLPHHLYHVTKVESTEKLFEFLQASVCDIVIVDASLKDSDGISLVRALSSDFNSYMLFVRSDTNDEIDRILSLELGADDCVAFSCGAREIKARVGALLRRRSKEIRAYAKPARDNKAAVSEIEYQGWIVNKDRCQLYSPSGDAISLTTVEYGILVSLFSNPGSIKDRSALRNLDSENLEYDFRAMDVFVSRLRKKMSNYGGQDLIETVRGRGYRLASTIDTI